MTLSLIQHLVLAQQDNSQTNPSDQVWLVAIDLLRISGQILKNLYIKVEVMLVQQACLSYMEGRALYGDGSWETYGANRGPLITLEGIKQGNWSR